jgi:hypothetical protein
MRAKKHPGLDIAPSQPTNVSDEQFAASLERLRAIHKAANPHFDDSRGSLYSGRGE